VASCCAMGRNSLDATNARLIRIARGEGRRLCLALTRAERAPDRLEGFLVVAVFADGLAVARWDVEVEGFFAVAGESVFCAAMDERRNRAATTPAKMRVPMVARVEIVGDFIDSL
jgi:hypothetical protein